MTNEEIQRQLDELEMKRNAINDASERHVRESDSVLANLRHSVLVLQKTVEDIKDTNYAPRYSRHTSRA